MENERQYAAKLRAESDQQWAQKLESLKQEMQRMTIRTAEGGGRAAGCQAVGSAGKQPSADG